MSPLNLIIMKKLITASFFAFALPLMASAVADSFVLDIATGDTIASQQIPEPKRTFEYFENRVVVTYEFDKVLVQADDLFPSAVSLRYKGFGANMETGEPEVSFRTDYYDIPDGFSGELELLESEYVDYEYELSPSRFPLYPNSSECYTAENVGSITVASTFPADIVESAQEKIYRGNKSQGVTVAPFQYCHAEHKLRAYTKIKFAVNFVSSDSDILLKANIASDDYAYLNRSTLCQAVNINSRRGDPVKIERDYLIITTHEYGTAARKMAEWKRRLGYNTYIVTDSEWTLESAKAAIKECYTEHPNLYFLLIIGDDTVVPAQLFTGKELVYHDDNAKKYFVSDMCYACMDGEDDFEPDLYYGRMPAGSLEDAMTMVDKSIAYERARADDTYVERALYSTYFEDPNKMGKARMTYTKTVENVLSLTGIRYDEIERLYYTEPNIIPAIYSDDTRIPDELRKPNFAWDCDAVKIYNEINKGCSMFLHMDHGHTSEFQAPWFHIDHIGHLKNKDRCPVLFSIECLTGSFERHDKCISNRFLSYKNGGFSAIVAASIESGDGYNKYLAEGLFESLFPTGYPDFKPVVGSIGEALRAGLNKMEQEVRGSYKLYHKRIYHCLGDPSVGVCWKKSRALKDRVLVNRSNNSFYAEVMESDPDLGDIRVYLSVYHAGTGECERYYVDEYEVENYNSRNTNVIISSPGERIIEYEQGAYESDVFLGSDLLRACSYSPMTGDIVVKTQDLSNRTENISIEIRDQSGNPVYSKETDRYETVYRINMIDKNPGLYIVSVVVDGEVNSSKQIIKN